MTNIAKVQTVGYIRVSSSEQNIARQQELFKGFNIDEVFVDYASGKSTQRPELKAAIKYLRKGDKLIVTSMDRLARNLDDLRAIVKDLNSRQVAVQFIKESLIFSGDDTPMSNLLLSVMGAFAEFERSLIRERQKEGIEIAKNKGLYKGRKPCFNAQEVAEIISKDKLNGYKNRSLLAKQYGITRQTLYNYLATNS